MVPHPLSFAQLIKVLAFNQISLVKSPPAPEKHPYFVGPNKAAAFFPYSSGPVQYLDRPYDDSEMLPVKLIHSIVKHMGLERERFWKDVDAVAAHVTALAEQPKGGLAKVAQVELKTNGPRR